MFDYEKEPSIEPSKIVAAQNSADFQRTQAKRQDPAYLQKNGGSLLHREFNPLVALRWQTSTNVDVVISRDLAKKDKK